MFNVCLIYQRGLLHWIGEVFSQCVRLCVCAVLCRLRDKVHVNHSKQGRIFCGKSVWWNWRDFHCTYMQMYLLDLDTNTKNIEQCTLNWADDLSYVIVCYFHSPSFYICMYPVYRFTYLNGLEWNVTIQWNWLKIPCPSPEYISKSMTERILLSVLSFGANSRLSRNKIRVIAWISHSHHSHTYNSQTVLFPKMFTNFSLLIWNWFNVLQVIHEILH